MALTPRMMWLIHEESVHPSFILIEDDLKNYCEEKKK